MLTYNNQFQLELMKLVDEKIAHLVENVVLGMAVSDHAEYRYQIGQIAGLKSIIELSDEVNSILAQR